MGRIIPYIMENKKCLKPPTSKVVCLCEMVLVQKKYNVFMEILLEVDLAQYVWHLLGIPR